MKNIPNQIDLEFNRLMDYIKDKTYEQIVDSIKHNFAYMNKAETSNYIGITAFYNKHKLWGNIDLGKGEYELIENNAHSLVDNVDKFEWLYDNLGDYRSKKILVSILYYWLMLDFKRVQKIQDSTYSQYFDLDLIKCDENEVFVDIGGYIGDTFISYVKTFGKKCYKKIYCYEIVPANIEYIKKNIELFELENIVVCEKGVSDKKGVLALPKDEVSSVIKLVEDGDIQVETVTIDDDIPEDVTFIKMDIEGAEETALLGCLKKISQSHPKLALSAYHNNEHLWKLAKIIHEVDPSYKFYFRYYGGALLPTEYILYAI